MIKMHKNMSEQYPDTFFGILVVENFHEQSGGKEAFDEIIKRELKSIRAGHIDYDRKAFCETNKVVNPYVRYYKRFKKTYHVLPQLESILSGKPFPEASPLVQVLFLTELKTSLLIAGHDLKKCRLPLTIQAAQGGESFLGSGQRDITLKRNDICLRDTEKYILSIIYGQDESTRITEETSDVLYLIDGVPGLEKEEVEEGLSALLDYVRVYAPGIVPKEMKVLSSSSTVGMPL